LLWRRVEIGTQRRRYHAESEHGQREPARAGKRRNSESVCEENTAIQTGARLFARV